MRRWLLPFLFLLALPARADWTVTNTTGGTLTNVVVGGEDQGGLLRRDGDIPNCPIPYISGTVASTYQIDVKNRYADGSFKFGIATVIVPSIAAGAQVIVNFDNNATCPSNTPLTKTQMLSTSSPNYDFDAQIQLTGTASHNISARTILTAASSVQDCTGTDPDGLLATSGTLACYWLAGPVVTCVILEDRYGRIYDVNTDAGTGNPLHPRFEACFYPQNTQVSVGYTLEDDWASTTAANSARDQTYSIVLTGGNSSPATEWTNTSFTQITRSMWHKTFCIVGSGAGTANGCEEGILHVDHDWPYLAQTKAFPNWDPTLTLVPTYVAGLYSGIFGTASQTTLQGCTTCFGGAPGVGAAGNNLNAGGGDFNHGPLTTWELSYLIGQCDAAYSTNAVCGNGSAGDLLDTMLVATDLYGMLPYWYREADAMAGHGQYFDAPNDTIGTLGRIVSINARTQVSLYDVTTAGSQGNCNTNYAADWINYGGAGQDLGIWGNVQDTSHWPSTAYVAYMVMGEYAYYDQEVMQAAYALANSPGTEACNTPGGYSTRGGALGYWDNTQERAETWASREHALGAYIAIDGSPEKTYLTDKLNTNLAVYEGSHGIACDIQGIGVQEPYCGASGSAWYYGSTSRHGNPLSGTTLGSWTTGVCAGSLSCYASDSPLCTTGSGCVIPGAGNANFQNNYSGFVNGLFNDFGYCPLTGGVCQMLQFTENWFINTVLDPNAAMYVFGNYTYPTLDPSDTQIPNWAAMHQYYASGNWPPTSFSANDCNDETYAGGAIAALSYGYTMTSNESYLGATAFNQVRPAWVSLCATNTFPGLGSGTPKWDIIPRVYNVTATSQGGGGGTPMAATPIFAPSSGNVPQSPTITSATSGATICYTINATPSASIAGTCDGGSMTLTNGDSISVVTAETVEALATESGYVNSGVASATYTSGGGSSGFVQSSGFSGFASETSISQTLTTTAGNQGVFVLDYGSAGVGTWTCSDVQGDIWVVGPNQDTTNYGLIAYTLNLAGGSTTVTCMTTGGASNLSGDFREYHGYPAFDTQGMKNTASGSTFTLSITTTKNASDMMIAGSFDGSGMGLNAPTNSNQNLTSGQYGVDGDGNTSAVGSQTITATQSASFGGAIIVLALAPGMPPPTQGVAHGLMLP